jgi:hypothetical protein
MVCEIAKAPALSAEASLTHCSHPLRARDSIERVEEVIAAGIVLLYGSVGDGTQAIEEP